MDDEGGLEFSSEEFYLKSADEMYELFPALSDAVERTAEIAEKCNVEFEFGKTKLPHFEVEGDHFEYLKGLCEKGMSRLYGPSPAHSIVDRMNYELDVINKMGYVDYYLIVYDFINFAKSRGIPWVPEGARAQEALRLSLRNNRDRSHKIQSDFRALFKSRAGEYARF